jgi:N-acetylglucosaminyldiphosphoundecaprenol N-acetyl-beta-D-mannosaminyltransferase
MACVARTDFLGVSFFKASMDEAVREIIEQGTGRKQFRYVVTPNVQNMVQYHKEPSVLEPVLRDAWRVFCDSRVLALLARFHGIELEVITGSDLSRNLIERANALALRIAIVGSTQADCIRLAEMFPRLRIAQHVPPMGFILSQAEVENCIDFVVATSAPLTFLAVGMPQQAILARRIANHDRARGVGLCIGASIDFLTGRQRRAPVWMQKSGLEWCFRLLCNPKGMAHRYLVECPYVFKLMLQKK